MMQYYHYYQRRRKESEKEREKERRRGRWIVCSLSLPVDQMKWRGSLLSWRKRKERGR
jgi:hypothetical protein